MANYTIKTATLSAGYSYSNGVLIPRNHGSVTIYTPAALAAPMIPIDNYLGAVWKIQLTSGETGDVSTDVWSDAYTFDASMGGANAPTQLVFPFTALQALTIPATYIGIGVMRISTFDTTQPADAAFTVLFGSFNN